MPKLGAHLYFSDESSAQFPGKLDTIRKGYLFPRKLPVGTSNRLRPEISHGVLTLQLAYVKTAVDVNPLASRKGQGTAGQDNDRFGNIFRLPPSTDGS